MLTKEAMLSHLKALHEGLTSEQNDTIVSSSTVTPTSFGARECPFCDDWANNQLARTDPKGKQPGSDKMLMVSVARFKRHVASHMEQLAIFAVPRSTNLSEGSWGSDIAGSLSTRLSLNEDLDTDENMAGKYRLAAHINQHIKLVRTYAKHNEQIKRISRSTSPGRIDSLAIKMISFDEYLLTW